MAVTWKVASLDATKTVGSLSDVVTTVHWTASDSETVGSGDSAVVHNGSSYGSIGLAAANSSSFTAYKDIKEADAIAWAKAQWNNESADVVTLTKLEEAIKTEIEAS